MRSELFSHKALFIDQMLLLKYAWCILKDFDASSTGERYVTANRMYLAGK